MTTDPSSFKLELVKLELREVGGYRPMYHRPYTAHLNPGTLSRLEQLIAGKHHGEIQPEMMADFATKLVSPAKQPSQEVFIPNGWAAARWVFMLEVLCTSKFGHSSTYYFQGYSTEAKRQSSGQADLETCFIINAFTQVNHPPLRQASAFHAKDKVAASWSVLSKLTPMENLKDADYLLRPLDIARHIGLDPIKQEYGSASIVDTRGMLTSIGTAVSRNLAIPSHYVARLADGYVAGKEAEAFFDQEDEFFASTHFDFTEQHLVEPHLLENPFIRQVASTRDSLNPCRFTLADLETLQPGFLTSNRVVEPASDLLPNRANEEYGTGASWYQNTENSWAAALLSQAIPALMAKVGIEEIRFSISSHDPNKVGVMDIRSAWSRFDVDITDCVRTFEEQFISEILMDMTNGNQIPYSFNVSINTMGESWLLISYGGAHAEEYLVPTFCDSLFSPMVTPSQKAYQALLTEVQGAVQELSRT